MKIDEPTNGGPAFWKPSTDVTDAHLLSHIPGAHGMSLRDYFAAKALSEHCANGWPSMSEYPEISKRCYLLADAMIKAREAKP